MHLCNAKTLTAVLFCSLCRYKHIDVSFADVVFPQYLVCEKAHTKY